MDANRDRSIFTEKLSRHYGSLRAVQNVDLAVSSGEVFALLGRDGSGKSTFINVLTTILAPTTGRALVAGHNVVHDGHRVRQQIGVAFQDAGLDPRMTARELLVLQGRLCGMVPGEARSKAERLLYTVGLADTERGRLVKQYSGGMKRRLDLALALVHDPPILFLDEPTAGLDPAGRVAIWEEVARLNRDEGTTVFLATQCFEEADRLADRVAVIDRGAIVAEGHPGELKSAVGNEAVRLSFRTPELAARASDLLALVVPQQQVNGSELHCYFAEAAPALPDIVRRLDAASLPLEGLVLSRPSLDDVLLRATGGHKQAERA